MSAEQQQEPMGPEFERAAAEADAVAREMAGGEPGAQPGGGGPAEPAAPAPSNTEIVGAMLGMARGLPFMARRFPRAAACLTDEVIAENAAAVGGVMDKYGLSFGGLDAWAVELRAVVAVGSLAWALSDALAADLQSAKADQARVVPAAPDAAPPAAEPAPSPEGSWASATPA